MTKDQQPSQGDVERVARAIARTKCDPLLMSEISIGLFVDKRWHEQKDAAEAAIAALHSTSEGRVEQMREAIANWFEGGKDSQRGLWDREADELVEAIKAALGGSNE